MKNDNYEDIINLKHHISKKHPPMDIQHRAAQFAPFAALTGYDDNIKEATRIIDKRIELDEQRKILINDKLQLILENIKEEPIVNFTYFVYDDKKDGGKYIEETGIVKKIDMIEEYILLKNKIKIPIKEIIDINSEILKKYQIY
jgi:hypothetical protein